MTNPTRRDFRSFHRLRVRWVEVDMQKIVFNGHYLMYFDTAISDYWRALAFPYESAMHLLGGDLFVKKASVEYHASARYDDLLDVGLTCSRVGNSSIIFTGGIFRGDELLITCELIYVFADPATQKSKPVPPVLRDMFTDFEAGREMVTLDSRIRLVVSSAMTVPLSRSFSMSMRSSGTGDRPRIHTRRPSRLNIGKTNREVSVLSVSAHAARFR